MKIPLAPTRVARSEFRLETGFNDPSIHRIDIRHVENRSPPAGNVSRIRAKGEIQVALANMKAREVSRLTAIALLEPEGFIEPNGPERANMPNPKRSCQNTTYRWCGKRSLKFLSAAVIRDRLGQSRSSQSVSSRFLITSATNP